MFWDSLYQKKIVFENQKCCPKRLAQFHGNPKRKLSPNFYERRSKAKIYTPKVLIQTSNPGKKIRQCIVLLIKTSPSFADIRKRWFLSGAFGEQKSKIGRDHSPRLIQRLIMKILFPKKKHLFQFRGKSKIKIFVKDFW